ncbi:MAG: hypothetical protein LQ339_005388 [Xanthoria mediterranea]|nr:MAG: hypothetical protein LQ339_005388 [Xanthoria mediterranea]
MARPSVQQQVLPLILISVKHLLKPQTLVFLASKRSSKAYHWSCSIKSKRQFTSSRSVPALLSLIDKIAKAHMDGTDHCTIPPDPQLLCISKAVRESYQTKIFSENIFVVGPGQTDRTLRFLGLTYPLPICRAHASFSYRDLGEDWAAQLPIGVAPPSEEDSANTAYLKRKIRRAAFNGKPEQSYCDAQARLIGLWIAKYCRLSQLPLEELTFDFTECYGGCNEWLGSFVAKFIRVRSPPARSSLRVIAPDDGKRLCIHDILSKPSR